MIYDSKQSYFLLLVLKFHFGTRSLICFNPIFRIKFSNKEKSLSTKVSFSSNGPKIFRNKKLEKKKDLEFIFLQYITHPFAIMPTSFESFNGVFTLRNRLCFSIIGLILNCSIFVSISSIPNSFWKIKKKLFH